MEAIKVAHGNAEANIEALKKVSQTVDKLLEARAWMSSSSSPTSKLHA